MNIYTGNLAPETTEDELREEFAIFGEVVSVTIMNDKYIGSGQHRKYGYVEMASRAEGATAVASLEGKKLRNMSLCVVEALPLSDKHGADPLNVRGNRRINKKRERRDIVD